MVPDLVRDSAENVEWACFTLRIIPEPIEVSIVP
ncbi:hypothetical protein CLV41_11236 [Roseibium marinum]|uniref:Uncharacterized protein n=1 Tax=Roseibium marinum TaxID=281252 RepID=A0A2S3UM37_9HYPH|nr:hypothetical protein CLV41_11236 [Roseibium marinum]